MTTIGPHITGIRVHRTTGSDAVTVSTGHGGVSSRWRPASPTYLALTSGPDMEPRTATARALDTQLTGPDMWWTRSGYNRYQRDGWTLTLTYAPEGYTLWYAVLSTPSPHIPDPLTLTLRGRSGSLRSRVVSAMLGHPESLSPTEHDASLHRAVGKAASDPDLLAWLVAEALHTAESEDVALAVMGGA